MRPFWQQAWAIVRKDLAMEMRSRERTAATLVFALIVTLVFHFTLDLRTANIQALAPGILWVAFAFAGMLGLSRSFVRERDEGCLDALLLCPVDRSVIYVGKMIGNFLFVSVAEAVLLPILFALFNLPFPPLLLAIIPLGTLGLCAVGTLFAAMTAYTRAREMLLPVLFFPVVIPVLTAAGAGVWRKLRKPRAPA